MSVRVCLRETRLKSLKLIVLKSGQGGKNEFKRKNISTRPHTYVGIKDISNTLKPALQSSHFGLCRNSGTD